MDVGGAELVRNARIPEKDGKGGLRADEFSSVVGPDVFDERDKVIHDVVHGVFSSGGSSEVSNELLEGNDGVLAFNEQIQPEPPCVVVDERDPVAVAGLDRRGLGWSKYVTMDQLADLGGTVAGSLGGDLVGLAINAGLAAPTGGLEFSQVGRCHARDFLSLMSRAIRLSDG